MSSFRTDLTVDEAKLNADLDRWVSGVLRAGTGAVRATTRKLEKALETTTRSTVKGRLHRAWKSQAFPAADIPAYAPSGTIYVNGGKRSQGAMQYWTQPGVNKSKAGYWLAIPTPAAGSRGRDRHITPGEWERRTGVRLIFVYRGASRPALLVAEGTLAKGGPSFREFTEARRRGGQHPHVTVPIFVLIPFQRFANRISIKPIILRHEAILARDFEQRVAQLDRAG